MLSNGYVSVAIAKSIGHAYLVNKYGNSPNSLESGTVSIYDINQTDGTLTLSSAESYVYTGYNPLAIAISESHAYVVNNKGNSPKSAESGTVSIYDIDPENGTLKLSEAKSYIYTGYGPTAIAISESYAYVINSFRGSNDGNGVGTISMYSINPNGVLSKLSPSTTVSSTGYRSTAIALNGSYAYVTNARGENNQGGKSVCTISMYSINPNGVLSKLSPSTESSTGYFSTTITLNGDYAYVTNAYGESNEPGTSVGTVSIYNINSVGALTLSPVESYVYTQYVPSFIYLPSFIFIGK